MCIHFTQLVANPQAGIALDDVWLMRAIHPLSFALRQL
jgi:hypothetical protein